MDDTHAGYGAVKPINRLVSNDLKADARISFYALFNHWLEPFDLITVRRTPMVENPTSRARGFNRLWFDECGVVTRVLGF
jgi:hypothetical protein